HDEAVRLTSNKLVIKPIEPRKLEHLRQYTGQPTQVHQRPTQAPSLSPAGPSQAPAAAPSPASSPRPGSAAPAPAASVQAPMVSPATAGAGSGEGFTGQLDQFQLIDIIQMCCISRKTGKLTITRGAQSGILYVKEGNIIHAEVGAKQGDEAVYEIVAWDYGRFALDLQKTSPVQTIHAGWEHLLMEGTRRRDESRGKDEVNLRQQAEGRAQDLIGKTVGPYTISRQLAQDTVGTLYEAIQANVNRPVAVKVLHPRHYDDQQTVTEFIAFATAMAKAQSPYITAVYEVGESNGLIYYTREHFPGMKLSEQVQQGNKWSEDLILRTVHNIANAFAYLHKNNILHHPLAPDFILISEDGTPKLLNNVTLEGGAVSEDEETEIRRLAEEMIKVSPMLATLSDDLRSLLNSMLGKERPIMKNWFSVAQRCQSIEMMRRSARAAASSQMLTPVTLPAVTTTERKRKPMPIATVIQIFGAILAILIVVGLSMGWFKKKAPKDVGSMIRIPSTTYKFQDGNTVHLPDFYIDKYEVTIDQYAKFLAEYDKNPNIVAPAPGMPPDLSHKPLDWDRIMSAVRNHTPYEGQELTGSCPVFNVSWWDAWAYAAWSGKRLPTEEEWELAMSGGKQKFPWGNTLEPTDFNSGDDYDVDPAKAGQVDGFVKWAPVGSFKEDKSPYGVMDMAGNVQEWTQTAAPHEHLPSEQVYVIRGASYQTPASEVKDGIFLRVRTVTPRRQLPFVGFRCASDKPVADK
ncbi:MAG: SUMF1/EgtB/PvdO family nonheme iron enzyme, partial [Verrucomicrobiae bacterium]|nr:SUMF1/EgtB/PvdO family nonheme iron enzyme [Verrucomicrobiae bacterium]